MITDHDRSGWFGASDTAMIMGNWNTKTFQKWWLQKLGINQSHFTNTAMNAGTYYEHKILNFLNIPRKDHQIIVPEYRLRINLDGDVPAITVTHYYETLQCVKWKKRGEVHEVKTHKAGKPFKVSKAYWQQVQVQGYGKLREEGVVPAMKIHAYALTDAEYRNFFLDIDPDRLTEHPIEYDSDFIQLYLERLKILVDALDRGAMPQLM